jgi:bifunctional DNA-binding transcriptional regulator/antitoxin component of YhaV-PrlF toxin-antitoxin module
MKLQKQLSRKVGRQKYPKFVVTISPKTVKELGWKPGQELEIEVRGKEAKIKPK